NDPSVATFSKQLKAFAKDPTCGKDDRVKTKREEKNAQLSKRHDLSKSDWLNLLMQIAAIASGATRTYRSTLMAEEYNKSYASDTGLGLNHIAKYQADWPNTDSLYLTQDLMCLGKDAPDMVDDYEKARSSVCINKCPKPSKNRRDLDNADSSPPLRNASNLLKPRVISPWDEQNPGNGDGSMPSWSKLASLSIIRFLADW
ncbi:hypothetical protein KEM54_004450, partial [Ascosphaera aggregata]